MAGLSKTAKLLVYDKLVLEAEAHITRANPCGIHKGPQGKSVCLNTQSGEAMCCDICEHRGPDGCTVKSLGCKVWLCGDARNRNPVLAASLDTIRDMAYSLNIPRDTRASKEQLVKRGRFT